MAEVLHRRVRYDATVADTDLDVVATRVDRPHEGDDLHKIVVVGGGAAGLQLITRLGDCPGRRRRASVTSVDQVRLHRREAL
jgi:NADH dehydrogenase